MPPEEQAQEPQKPAVDEVIVSVSFRVKREDAEAFKNELDSIVEDFVVDDGLAKREGEISITEVPPAS